METSKRDMKRGAAALRREIADAAQNRASAATVATEHFAVVRQPSSLP